MPAYLIARVWVRDPSYIAEYRAKTKLVVARHGGRDLVGAVHGTGALEQVEGSEPLPTAVFVIEFPSMENAKAFYRDPDYAPMIELRQSGADSEIVLVQGL